MNQQLIHISKYIYDAWSYREFSQLFNLNVFRIELNRQGDDGSVGPVGDGRMHEAISHTCLSSSAEYELALILKELRWITDQVSLCWKQ